MKNTKGKVSGGGALESFDWNNTWLEDTYQSGKTNKLTVEVIISVYAVWCGELCQACMDCIFFSLMLKTSKNSGKIYVWVNQRKGDEERMRSDMSVEKGGKKQQL